MGPCSPSKSGRQPNSKAQASKSSINQVSSAWLVGAHHVTVLPWMPLMPAVLGRHEVVTSKGPDCPSMLQPGERKQCELEKGCEAPYSQSLCPSPGQGGSSNIAQWFFISHLVHALPCVCLKLKHRWPPAGCTHMSFW